MDLILFHRFAIDTNKANWKQLNIIHFACIEFLLHKFIANFRFEMQNITFYKRRFSNAKKKSNGNQIE